MNEGNPNTVWEALRTAYGTPGAAGIFVEFKKMVRMQIKKNEDPATRVNEMQSIFNYLAANGLTLPNSAQAMILLSALPAEWEGFASTILATLPVTLPAGAPAGAQALTFTSVLPKINEEWSRRSGHSVMPRFKEERKENNAFAGPSKVNKPRCKTCNGCHSTKDHIDGYKRPNAPPQAGPSQPKKPFTKGKGKKDYKGKGKQRANAAEQVASIVMLNSKGETDDEDTGYASQTAEASWSVTTQSILNADSSSPLEDERYMRRKQMDDEYAHRLATAPKEEYDPYYHDDNYGWEHWTSYTSRETKCSNCHLKKDQSKSSKEHYCPKHEHLAGLWLLDSGATDHSTPYMSDFLTYKKLPKPLRVKTAGSECIFFTGIGTVTFTTNVDGQQKLICLRQVYFSPSGDKRICSLQWLTTRLKMTLTADAKTTRIFNSHGQPFLTGQCLLSGNNLHWVIGKPHNRTGALGYLVNLNIKSVDTVQLATDRQEDFNDFDLWHQRLGHPSPQTMWHASRTTDGFGNVVIPNRPPICSDCQIGKMPTRSFPPSDK